MDEARGGPVVGGGGELGPDASGRSPYRTTCPYFRLETADGALLAPLERPDPANRCAAIGPPMEQSLRQQAMACLSPEHDACPRYIHAEGVPRQAVPRQAIPRQAVVRVEAPPQVVVRVEAPRPEPRSRAPLPEAGPPRRQGRATLVAFLVLLASLAASFAFVVSRGGLSMSDRSSLAPNQVAAATATPAGTAVAVAATLAPSPPPTPTALPTPEPTPVPTAVPTAAPTAAPPATPRPTKRATPRPTSERYAYLEPCASKPNCWVYTIRRGDALYNLARYFGHPLETIYRLNPWTKVRGIQPGDKLILPPPTL